MFGGSSFERTMDNACSHLHLEPDWPAIMEICDMIRQNDVTPKHAVQTIKKKLLSQNPHTAYYALLVLESVVKNCGAPVHDEISTKENCEVFSQVIETTPHETVKAKMLELIQAWAYAFRTSEKYQATKDTMTILKTKGHAFPELKEADAMFTSDTAPIWRDGKCCHHCRVEFSFTQRKHHCRNCGQIFCAQCSAKACTLPKFGIEKEVRVCEPCYIALQKPVAAAAAAKRTDSDLPAEYLNSSLAQQPQTPARKTEQELREDEELQLALALSQSEAEQKSRSSSAYRTPFRKSSIENISVASPIAPTLRDASPPLSPSAFEDRSTDPELATYLNRDYWEQRNNISGKSIDPTAPSPMVTPQPIVSNASLVKQNTDEDAEIETFASSMKTQVEIFVNRMKSNSSRGRSISTDSSVQSLFLNLTTFHSRLLEYIKKADDKRMWFEQLQDKLTQIKDSRAALDVLRQEHQEKLRQQAEEQERQRQMQMAYKLELMRKKKQEYLQYQRQLALQRIQEQEREMRMHQDQQKVMYSMGVQQTYGPPPGAFIPASGAPGAVNLPNASRSPPHMINVPQPIGLPHGQLPGYGHNGAQPNVAGMGSAFNPVGMQRYPMHAPAPIYGQMPPNVNGMQPMPGQYHMPQQTNMNGPPPNVGPHEFISSPPQVQSIPAQQQPQQHPPQQQPNPGPPHPVPHEPQQLNEEAQQPSQPAPAQPNEPPAAPQVAEAELISFD